MMTFLDFLLTEGNGAPGHIKQIINRFLAPVADDETKFNKRMLLGREVIHTIEDSLKHSTKMNEDEIDGEFFSEMRRDAHSAVNDLLAPPSSEHSKRAKFRSMATQFNRYIVDPIVDAVSSGTNDEEILGLIDYTVDGVVDEWNMYSRQLKPKEAGETRQKERKYTQARKRSGPSTKQQKYKSMERQAKQ